MTEAAATAAHRWGPTTTGRRDIPVEHTLPSNLWASPVVVGCMFSVNILVEVQSFSSQQRDLVVCVQHSSVLSTHWRCLFPSLNFGAQGESVEILGLNYYLNK